MINKSRTTEALLQKREDLLNSGASVPRLILVTSDISCTLDNTTNTVNDVAHGRSNDDRVQMGGTLPSELNNETFYYIVNATTDTYQLSLTSGGAAVTFTTDGSSVTYSVWGVNIGLNSNVFNTPTSDATKSTMVLNVSPEPTATPDANVTIAKGIFCDSDLVPYWSVTVTESGGGGEMIASDTELSTLIDVKITSYTIEKAFE